MADAPNPFEALMKMSNDWTKAMGQASEAFSPEALEKLWPTVPKEMMEAFLGKGLNPEGLDAKTRLLLTLQGLMIQGGQAETQMRLTMRQAQEMGVTDQEMNETIALAGLFGGAAGAAKALEIHAAMREDTK